MNPAFQSWVLVIATVAICVSCIDGQACRRPDSSMGRCVSVYYCASVLNAIRDGVSSEVAEQLRALRCMDDTGSTPSVCCDVNDDRMDTPAPRPATRAPSTGYGAAPSPYTGAGVDRGSGGGADLPTLGHCGPDEVDDRIYGGTDAGLGQYPWMALFEYEDVTTHKTQFGCAGSLINSRYVLTAAHCYYDPKAVNLKLKNIRLGEYDTSSETDCINGDCADPVLNVGIEEFIVHPHYGENDRNRAHDIALVRLAQEVTFTDFIQPVCMPWVVALERTAPGKKVFVSGWGRTLRAFQSSIKQTLELPLFDHQTCVQKFASIKTDIGDQQLCAGGLFAVDTCDRDSGGPLMQIKGSNWAIEGIVSFGHKCGLEGWPGIYTRVASYEPWIRETIRA